MTIIIVIGKTRAALRPRRFYMVGYDDNVFFIVIGKTCAALRLIMRYDDNDDIFFIFISFITHLRKTTIILIGKNILVIFLSSLSS
jgi:hypothetical protein